MQLSDPFGNNLIQDIIEGPKLKYFKSNSIKFHDTVSNAFSKTTESINPGNFWLFVSKSMS